MADGSSNRGVIVVLASALGVALLTIAFLLGRLSERPERAPPTPISTDAVPSPPTEAGHARPAEPPALRIEEAPERPALDLAEPQRAGVLRIDRRPDGRIVLSNREPGDSSNASSETRAQARASDASETPDAVRDYLRRMERIHSVEGAGDPNAFAMQLIKAGLGGASSGFDRLIDDTKRMEAEIERLTPPPSCEQYHEASLRGMAESREMLENLKAAIAARDIGQLTAIAREAAKLQESADALKAMEDEIRAGL